MMPGRMFRPKVAPADYVPFSPPPADDTAALRKEIELLKAENARLTFAVSYWREIGLSCHGDIVDELAGLHRRNDFLREYIAHLLRQKHEGGLNVT